MRDLIRSVTFWFAVVAVVLLVGLVASVVFWDCLEVFWDWLTDGESGSATIRNLGLVLAAIIALPLAIWRSVVADRQASAAQRQAETAQQSLLNERYERGAEMLGSGVLSVRLGGIYALDRLAKEHPYKYHVQIMALLCAFACNPTKDENYEEKLAERNANPRVLSLPREDVQAAIDAIGYRDKKRVEIETSQDFKLNLIGADLSFARIGNANLSGAMLNYANLSDTNIFSVDLSNAYLRGTVMKRADISDTDFTGARASNVDLSGAKVFQHNKPLFDLDYANLSPVQLSDGTLLPTHLFDADLSGKSIQRANLHSVQITSSDLSDTHFLDSKLPGAEIIHSNLSGARILRTDMSGATLRDTDLSGTYFYDPHGRTATSPVTGLTQAQLDEACADPDNPPKLDGVLDAETGEQLVWRGKPCEG